MLSYLRQIIDLRSLRRATQVACAPSKPRPLEEENGCANVHSQKPYCRLLYEFDVACALRLWGRSERRHRSATTADVSTQHQSRRCRCRDDQQHSRGNQLRNDMQR